GAGRQHAADGIHQRPGGRRELLVERQGTHRHEVHADWHWPRLYARAAGRRRPRSGIPLAGDLRRRRDGPPLRGQSEREARIAGPPDYRRGTGGWPPYHHDHPRRTGGQRSAHRHRGGKLVFAGLADHGTFQAFGPAYWGNRDPADEHRPRRTRAHLVRSAGRLQDRRPGKAITGGTDHRLAWSVRAAQEENADRRQKAIVCPTSAYGAPRPPFSSRSIALANSPGV